MPPRRGAACPIASAHTRMRANAAVFALAPPRTGKRGRPALKGARLASLAQLAAAAVSGPVTVTAPAGNTPGDQVGQSTCLWSGPCHTRPDTSVHGAKPDR